MQVKSYWVKALYDGLRAKSVTAHANSGIGYHILDYPSKSSVIAAFRIVGEIPHHCEKLTPHEIAKVELKEQMRSGVKQ